MDLDVQVVQFDTGGDPGTASTFARQVVLDPTFVLAVLAPFWEEPEDVGETLAKGGVPTFSLSPESASIWASGPGGGLVALEAPGAPEELWRRFVPDQGLQAERLAGTIEDAVPETSADPACLFAEDTVYARELRDAVEARSSRAGPAPCRRPPVTRTPPSKPSGQAVPSQCGSDPRRVRTNSRKPSKRPSSTPRSTLPLTP